MYLRHWVRKHHTKNVTIKSQQHDIFRVILTPTLLSMVLLYTYASIKPNLLDFTKNTYRKWQTWQTISKHYYEPSEQDGERSIPPTSSSVFVISQKTAEENATHNAYLFCRKTFHPDETQLDWDISYLIYCMSEQDAQQFIWLLTSNNLKCDIVGNFDHPLLRIGISKSLRDDTDICIARHVLSKHVQAYPFTHCLGVCQLFMNKAFFEKTQSMDGEFCYIPCKLFDSHTNISVFQLMLQEYE